MILKVKPEPKPRMTKRDRWAKRAVVLRYFQYCDDLRSAWGDTQVPARLDITFFVPMPKSWSAKKKLLAKGTPHQQRPDIDNFIKAFLDALCPDDSFVWEVHARKFWGDTGYIEAKGIDGK